MSCSTLVDPAIQQPTRKNQNEHDSSGLCKIRIARANSTTFAAKTQGRLDRAGFLHIAKDDEFQ